MRPWAFGSYRILYPKVIHIYLVLRKTFAISNSVIKNLMTSYLLLVIPCIFQFNFKNSKTKNRRVFCLKSRLYCYWIYPLLCKSLYNNFLAVNITHFKFQSSNGIFQFTRLESISLWITGIATRKRKCFFANSLNHPNPNR